MKLYMIRHGESTANLKGLHAGWGQFPLSEKGVEDAEKVGSYLRNISFDKFYCSDLLRARQTFELAFPGHTAEETVLLREIHVGELSGRSVQACCEEYGEGYLENKRCSNYVPYGGEDINLFHKRISQFMRLVEKQSCEHIAVFCHEGVIRGMLDLITGMQQDREAFVCENGSIFIFEYCEAKWKVLAWNSAVLHKFQG